VPVDIVVEPAEDAELSGGVCRHAKPLEVSMIRLLFAGRDTRDWSIELLLGEGRVMSAVA